MNNNNKPAVFKVYFTTYCSIRKCYVLNNLGPGKKKPKPGPVPSYREPGTRLTTLNTMHFWSNNIKAEYEMNGKFWEEVTDDRDLGVIIQNDLKCNSHCIKFRTANRVLGRYY